MIEHSVSFEAMHNIVETLSVPTVLARCFTVTVAQLCYCDTLSGPSGGSSYLGHYNNY